MAEYHDGEWGVPCHDDGSLFERLMLEGFQAGLSWELILKRREGIRAAFDGWDARRVATYDADDVARLMGDARIIRNRLKVAAATKNASAFLRLQEAHGTFDRYIWSFVGGRPRINRRRRRTDVPTSTPESDAMSKDLKRRGFAFVGTTICYAFMQATGMVNDHLVSCFRHAQLAK